MDKKDYYNNKAILFEMIKLCKDRELSMLSSTLKIRCIRSHNLSSLQFNFKRFDFLSLDSNLYYTLARINNMPIFSFNYNKRKEQQLDFIDKFAKLVYDIDLGLDFDCHDEHISFSDCYDDTKRLKELLDKYKIPYSLRFSGSGFHINIEWKYLKDCMDIAERIKRLNKLGPAEEEAIALLKWFVIELSEINNCPSLDTTVIDIRRIWKMPYSIDIRTGYVALPLTNEQFKKFSFDMVKPENVIDTIRDRGLLERPGTSENLKGFFENFLLV